MNVSPGNPEATTGTHGFSHYLGNQLLVGIPLEILEAIPAQISEQVFEPKEVVFEESDWGDVMYLIAEGSVRISKRGRGGQQETLAHLRAGDFFGDMALIDSGKRSAQATAEEKTVLGRVDKRAWTALIHAAPEVVFTNFTRSITQRLRDNNQRFIDEMMRNERLSLLGSTVSSIAHDMNNPITCILGACQIMQRKIPDPTCQQMSGIILKSLERMEAMTQELLDFARGTTNLSLHPVSISALVHDLEEQELFRCAAASIAVEKKLLYDGEILIDGTRILRLLANLVKNAREAMPHGGVLRLEVQRRDGFVVFTVADNGCGIPRELQAKIFEPFATFDKKNGTGLGLAIAKAVVDAHQGTIRVFSEAGEGTSFEVWLPEKC
jgi:signal transduction histidine kinase